MKNAVISTYCEWSSYGSVLQAIGLQSALTEMDVDSLVVRLQAETDMNPVKYRKGRTLRSIVVNAALFFDRKKTKLRFEKNNAFISENVKIKTYPSYSDLEKKPPEGDIYIAGSDQIWHPGICRNDFFLGYAPKDRKCISYAASMGVVELAEGNEERFRAGLKKFSGVSVREAEMIPVIQKVSNQPVQMHIDPTFLKSADEWRTLEKPYPVEKPYILVYPIYWDKKYNRQLKKIKKETGFQIISIHSGLSRVSADKVIRDASVGEFLWLVDHAQCVVTSSFHGVAFSTIFNKKFSAVVNPKAKSRINSLLGTLEMQLPSIDSCLSDFAVDYAAVNKKILEEKKRSFAYLRREIFGEV